MISSILKISPTSVTVCDANGDDCTVPIKLTPRRRFLTQGTKRAILATGFLLRYGEDLATDQHVINDVIARIRDAVLAARYGKT